MLQWGVVLILLGATCLLPLLWLVGNNLSPISLGPSSRAFLRTWTSMLCCTLWLSLQPTNTLILLTGEWEWQLPLFSAIPVVLTFGEEDPCISAFVMLCRLGIGAIGCILSFTVCTIVWLVKSEKVLQGVFLCAIQPLISGLFVLSQRRTTKQSLKRHIHYSHLLEIQIVFQSVLYGFISESSFVVWKLPVFVFASYTIGLYFIFSTVLFVAPRWECALPTLNDDKEESCEIQIATKIDESKPDDKKPPSRFDLKRTTTRY